MSRTGITKQPNGKYRAFVDCGYDYDGKRIRKTKTFATKKEAAAWQAETRLNSERLDISNSDITFECLSAKWLQSKKNRKITVGTLCKYENAIRIAREYPRPFYNQKARDIKKTDVESLLNYLAFDKGLSLNYIAKDIKQIISAIFTFGIDNDMLFKNPCKKADLPNIAPTKSTKDSFTPAEIRAIEKHYKNIPFGDIVYILINTGLRSQEICAIDDKSIIIDKKGQHYIRVDKAMKRTRGGGWTIGSTKTENSIRDIPISNGIYTLIMQRVIANKSHVLLPGRKAGTNISYDNFTKHYYRFFDALNLIARCGLCRRIVVAIHLIQDWYGKMYRRLSFNP